MQIEADSSLNQSLNKHQETFENAAMQIWNWAEVGYQEYKSSELLKAELAANGFTIQSGLQIFQLPLLQSSPMEGLSLEFWVNMMLCLD